MELKMVAALVLALVALSTLRSASSSSPSHNIHFRGIAPQDEKYYQKSDLIKCKDGSKKFSKAQLNDDFCDCSDGTDEPGTSACPNGRFYCRNAGHSPKLLFSSRVNDGICDCCDGSDEYNDTAKCPNTCWEAGKVARDKLKKKISTYLEGVTIRKQDIERAKAAMAKDEAELLKLQSEAKTLKGLVEELREHKEQIEKAEEKERLQKEKEEKERKEAEEKSKLEATKASHENGEDVEKADGKDEATESTNDDDKVGILDDSSSDQNIVEAGDDLFDEHGLADTSTNEESFNQDVEKHQEKEKEKEELSAIPETGADTGSKDSPDEVIDTVNNPSENTGDLSREELGRLVASRWTGENTEKKTEDVNGEKDDTHEHDNGEVPKDTHEDEEDGYASETDDDQHKYDEDTIEDEAYDDFKEENHDDSSSYKYDSDNEYESDTVNSDNPSFLEKIQQKIRHILQAVNLFQTPVNQSDAARIRKEFDDSTAKLSKMQSRISSLTQKLKQDFGVDKEFYTFYDQCFEGKENKYVYKVCPYKQASQEEDHSSTRLGRWDKFDDAYRSMVFSNGDKCWNGPDRSLKVKLRCGLKNEVTDVDEPSRCEYVAILSTPALCLEEKLKELQQKLDGMNKEQPENHDEL